MLIRAATFVAVTVVAMSILIGSYWILSRYGNRQRGFKAAVQGLRWFLAGAVIATVGDVFTNGIASDIMIPGALALVTLTFSEYVLLGTEQRGPIEIE